MGLVISGHLKFLGLLREGLNVCPKVDDIRRAVVTEIVNYSVILPAIRRPTKMLTAAEVKDTTKLYNLGFDYRDNTILAKNLAKAGLCRKLLPNYVTGRWTTVGDVIESVILYPAVK